MPRVNTYLNQAQTEALDQLCHMTGLGPSAAIQYAIDFTLGHVDPDHTPALYSDADLDDLLERIAHQIGGMRRHPT